MDDDSSRARPRDSRLGVVALMLAIGGAIAAVAAAGATPIAFEVFLFNPSTGRWVFASDAAESLAIPVVAIGLAGLAAGIAGLVLGILAIVRRARRAAGVAAVVVSGLVPGLAFLAFAVTSLLVEWA